MKNSSLCQKLRLAGRFLKHKVKGQTLRLVTIEVTKRCNAQCPFCSYWKEPKQTELEKYSDIVRYFDPMVVTLSGGEPLIRRDILDIIRDIRKKDKTVYISMVTNAALLTVEKAEQLHEAGLNQLSISLDYLDERHDEARVIPGLVKKIKSLLPGLSKVGFDIVSVNTVIKNDNLDEIPKILDLARENGISVGFSSFCEMKNGMAELNVADAQMAKLEQTIAYIKDFKRKNKVVTSSHYYLDKVIEYFRVGHIPGCLAGKNWVQVTPAGEIKRCSEFDVVEKDFRKYKPRKMEPMACDTCWFSCRGEAQAPIDLERIKELW